MCRNSFVFSQDTLTRAKGALNLKKAQGGCSTVFLDCVEAFMSRSEELLQDLEIKWSEISWSFFDFQTEFLRLCPEHTSSHPEATQEAMEWCRVNAGIHSQKCSLFCIALIRKCFPLSRQVTALTFANVL